MAYLHTSAPIIPGRSAGGFVLGAATADNAMLLAQAFRASYYAGPDIPGGFVIRYRSQPVELWESSGVISRIIVRDGYTGLVEEMIGIGATLEELAEAFGAWEPDNNGAIWLRDVPGIAFTADHAGHLADDDGARMITAISILPRTSRWP